MLKVGDKVVRNDGYSHGLVVAVLKDVTNLTPSHQVVIRQRRGGSNKDTIVTRDLNGHTFSKYDRFQFVKEKKKVTAERHYAYYTETDPETLYSATFWTLAERDAFLERNVKEITIRKLTTETITFEVDAGV